MLTIFLQNLKILVAKRFQALCFIAFFSMLPVNILNAETDYSSNFFMDIPIQDETLGPWAELLLNHSLTDYCGLQNWHVRQGYQILRIEYVKRWPISFTRLQALRTDVVDWTEATLVGKGLENFNMFCGVYGEMAAMFFASVWAEESSNSSLSKTQL